MTAPGGTVLRLRNWRRSVFDPAVIAAGLTDVTPHDLRHTAASLAVASGAHVKLVQRMLGHASAAMTLDVYAALFDDDLGTLAERMDAATATHAKLVVQRISVAQTTTLGDAELASRNGLTTLINRICVHPESLEAHFVDAF